MPQRGELQRDRNQFTGFVAVCDNELKIYEKESYFSKKLNKKCATNWVEIDKNKITSLELHWNGVCKVKIDKTPSDTHKKELMAKDWFFSHQGCLDMGTRKIKILSRNIGYIEDNILYITSVVEDTGEVYRSIRAATK
jgi:hypothetical protein